MDGRVGMVEIYRLQPVADGKTDVVPVVALQSPSLPPGHLRASSDRLAAKIAAGSSDTQAHEPLDGGGELVRAGVLVARRAPASRSGVVIASDFLSGELAQHARRIAEAYEDYSQLRVLKAAARRRLPLAVPDDDADDSGQRHVAGAVSREADHAAGQHARRRRARDRRRAPRSPHRAGDARRVRLAGRGVQHRWRASWRRASASSNDRASRWSARTPSSTSAAATSRRCSSGSRPAWSRSAPTAGSAPINTAAGAAARRRSRRSSARRSTQVLGREDLLPLGSARAVGARPAPGKPAAQEIALAREGARSISPPPRRRCRARAARTKARSLVFDDVTPLVRTQRVAAWRDVARRLAHEIKNPLTPIQLSRRAHAPALRRRRRKPTRALVDECTTTIVGEVESLKALVDEFAQFARMPAPRAVPSNLNAVLDRHARALQRPVQPASGIERRFAPALPPVRLDVEQIRRVVINLVDNAIEALGGCGAAAADGEPPRSHRDAARRGQRASRGSSIADNGPGVPAGRSREAVHAVLLDQGARQRPRPGDRPPHRRGARRHRSKSATIRPHASVTCCVQLQVEAAAALG